MAMIFSSSSVNLKKHSEVFLTIGTYLGILVMCGDRYFIYPVSAFQFKNSPIFLIGITIFILCYFFLIMKAKPSPRLLIPGAFFLVLSSLLNTGLLNGYTIVSDCYPRLGFFDNFVLGQPYTYLSQIYEQVYGMFAYLLVISKVTAIDSSTLSILLRTLCDFTIFLVIYLLSRHLFKSERVALFSGLLYLVFSPFHLHYCPGAQGTLLAFLALYFLLTSKLRQPRELVLCNLAVAALISTHHFSSYMYIVALLASLLLILIGRNIYRVKNFFKAVDYHTLAPHILLAIVAFLSWYLYVAHHKFSHFAHYVFKPGETVPTKFFILPHTPWSEKILSSTPLIAAFILTILFLYCIAKERGSFKSPELILYLGAVLGLGLHFAGTFTMGLTGLSYGMLLIISLPLLYYLFIALPVFGSALSYFTNKGKTWSLMLVLLLLSSVIAPALYDDPTHTFDANHVYTIRDFSTLVFTKEKIPDESIIEAGELFYAFRFWKSEAGLESDFELFYGDETPYHYISHYNLGEAGLFVVLSRELVPLFGSIARYQSFYWLTEVNQMMERFETPQFDKILSNNKHVIYCFREGVSL